MKQIKTLIAWLDWSTYCTNDSDIRYKFPTNLCNTFWRSLLSITLFLPLWFNHLWNLIVVNNKESFRKEKTHNLKLNYMYTGGIYMLILFGFVGYMEFDNEYFDFIKKSDSLILSYFKSLGLGLISIIIILIIVTLVILAIYYILVVPYRYIFKKSSKSKVSENINLVVDSVKNKYCPIIDWEEIKN